MTAAWTPGSTDAKAAYAEFKLHLKTITPRLTVIPMVVVLNVGVYIAMAAAGVSPLTPSPQSVIDWGANYGPLTLGAEPWRLLASVFVHFGALHLLGNMVALGTSGEIERLFGPLHFAAIYLIAGLTGSLASVTVHPAIVSAGASGAVFGIYGALGALVLLRRNAIPRVVLGRLGTIAGSFVVYNFMFSFGHKGIDNAAHLGGLVGGAVAGALLLRPLVPGRPAARIRPLLVAGAACALVLAGAWVLPAPVTMRTVAQRLDDEENRAIPAYNQLVGELKTGRIDGPEAARQLQTIVPSWLRMRAALDADIKKLDARRGTSPKEQTWVELLRRTVAVRADGWTAMMEPLRSGDYQAVARIMQDMNAKMQRVSDEIEALKRN